MKIVVAGLGRMGMQIVRKLSEDGHEAGAYNRSLEKVDVAAGYGAVPLKSRESVVKFFGSEPAILWLMITAEAVDSEIDEWLKLLPDGSILIDGGNSDYRLTKQRAGRVGEKLGFVDVGVSGGILGLKNGFSMMAGGNNAAYEHIKPVLDTLSMPHGGYDYFGESGSGHFVKMVHNGIEYGMMESLAEGFRVMKEGPYSGLDLVKAGQVWQKGSVIESKLNQLTAEALADNPTLDGIEGSVAESGEARWTLETAKELGIEMPAVQAAFDVRLLSQKGETSFATKLLAAMRNKFGGHQINPGE